jgi:sugar phosphate permease
MSGVLLMASQIGGAVVVPIQIRYGWRASFYVFGMLRILWAISWYVWFRDSPAAKPGVPGGAR